MKNEIGFETIGNHELANTTGGDFASRWLGSLKQDWKDLSKRSANVRHAVATGDVGGVVKNEVAGGVDGLGFAGDLVSPVAGIIGAKP